MNQNYDMLLKYLISATYRLCNFVILFLFLLGFCLNELFINMITVMKSLLLEAEISQYLIMVSDIKPIPNASISFLPHVLTNLFW